MQQVVDEGGAVQGVQACSIELGVVAAVRRGEVHLQVSEVQEGVEDEMVQELVVVSTILQIHVRPLICHKGYRNKGNPQILANEVRHDHHDAENIQLLEGSQIDH